jgi:hypothetical protein
MTGIRMSIIVTAGIAALADPRPPTRSTAIVAELPHASVSALAADVHGNIYAVGTTGSKEFDTTANALKRQCDGGGNCFSDAIVVRIGSRGEVTYATYLGGTSNETGNALAVDRDGNMYVAGTTWSQDYPVTRSLVAPRPAQQGFVTKISPEGRIVFSTTLGGEGINGIALGGDGAVYVTGFAYSTSVPMVNAIQPVIRSGPDAFIAKLAPDGSRVLLSTYLGGSGSDAPHAIAVDSDGSVVIAGDTASADFPAVRAIQPQHTGGFFDAFVARLAPDGSFLEFSTLLGGHDQDTARAVALDSKRDIYVIGATRSPDFPTTEGALDRTCGTDAQCDPHEVITRGRSSVVTSLDGFATSLTHRGEWRFSTFLGGGSWDEGRALGLRADGRVLVAGFSTSKDFAAKRPVVCDDELTCPEFVIQIDEAGATLLTADRMTVTASYAPMFDQVAMALDPDGSVLVASNAYKGATFATITRLSWSSSHLPVPSPCRGFGFLLSPRRTCEPAPSD